MMRSSFCGSVSVERWFYYLQNTQLDNVSIVYDVFAPVLTVFLVFEGHGEQFFVLLPNRDDVVLAIVNTKFGDHLLPWFPQRHCALTLELNVREMTDCVIWWKVRPFCSIEKDHSGPFFRFSECVHRICWSGKPIQLFSTGGVCHKGLRTFFFPYKSKEYRLSYKWGITRYTYRRVPRSGKIGKNKAKLVQ